MIQEIAQDTVDAFAAKGVNLSADEIVTLNQFAVADSQQGEVFQTLYPARLIRVGDLTFRELTIGHYHFMATVSPHVDLDGESGFVFNAFLCATPLEELPDPEDLASVEAAVAAFAKRIEKHTIALVSAAVRFATVGPYALPRLKEGARKDLDAEAEDWALGLAVRGCASEIGLTLKDALALRPEAVYAAIRVARAERGKEFGKGSFGRFYAYCSALEEKYGVQIG